MAPTKICTRPSCGAELPPATTTDDAVTSPSSASSSYSLSGTCTHHPGQPIFHEGQKSWSCCNHTNKPVLDFDDFVKIQGCTTVEGHSIEKPVKKVEEKKTMEDIKGVMGEDGKEVFGNLSASTASKGSQQLNGMARSLASSSSSPSTSSTAAASQTPSAATPPPVQIEPSDPEGSIIPPGAPCKRPGCSSKFSEDPNAKRDRSTETCRYHRGFPIFHEGSKGYSCCKRRVLDFNDFLKIEPCSTSSSGHLFVQPLASQKKKALSNLTSHNGVNGGKESEEGAAAAGGAGDDLLKARGLILKDGEEETDCRMDHYETPEEIRMTIYSKGVEMEDSIIIIEEEDIFLSLSLPPNPTTTSSASASASSSSSSSRRRRHLLHLPLYSSLDPSTSFYKVSPSKIKIDFVLKKKLAGLTWPTLLRGGMHAGYGLTFGRK